MKSEDAETLLNVYECGDITNSYIGLIIEEMYVINTGLILIVVELLLLVKLIKCEILQITPRQFLLLFYNHCTEVNVSKRSVKTTV